MTTQMGTHHRGYCCSKMRHTHSHHRCCFLCVPFRWLGFANKYTGRTVSWELGHHYQNPDKRSPSGFRMARCPHQSGTWQSPFQALGSHPFRHLAVTLSNGTLPSPIRHLAVTLALAGGRGGKVERRLTLGNLCVGRAGAVPLTTQGYPTTEVGREWKQRFEGAVEFQRDYDQSRTV
jgi:hypothetical protein